MFTYRQNERSVLQNSLAHIDTILNAAQVETTKGDTSPHLSDPFMTFPVKRWFDPTDCYVMNRPELLVQKLKAQQTTQ